MANEPLAPAEETPWWWVRLGRALISLLPGTAADSLEEASDDDTFSDEQVAEEPVTPCSGGATSTDTTPPKKPKKKKKKKKPAAKTTTDAHMDDDEEQADEPPTQTQELPPPPSVDTGGEWSSTTKERRRREARWYDNLPRVSASGKSDACDSIASGRGQHTTDHLRELIEAVGEGDFDREILARLIAEAFRKNEVVATNSGISRHYLLTEIPHALEESGTKQLVSPIIVVYNTLVDPRLKSYGTCYPTTWTKANAYRRGNTA